MNMPSPYQLPLAGLTMLAGIVAAYAQPVELISTPEDANFYADQGNLDSGANFGCDISVDGGRIAFTSRAFNLFSDDHNATSDVLLFDNNTLTLQAASINSSGEQANGLNQNESISGDGRYVLFESDASNLGVTQTRQSFRHDLLTGETIAVGFAADGSEFSSVFPQDLSGDGNLAVFTTNDDSQAWVRNISQGVSTMLTEGIDGEPADSAIRNAEISTDGHFVVFESAASNLVANDNNAFRDIFIHNLNTGIIERIDGQADDDPNEQSLSPAISADGRWIVFSSLASNLVAADIEEQQDVFLYDRINGSTLRISERADGTGGNAASSNPVISPDGRFVVFESEASNLVNISRGLESLRDLFLYDRDNASLQKVAEGAREPRTGCVTADATQVLIAYPTTTHPLIPTHLKRLQIVLEAVPLDPLRQTTGTAELPRVISAADAAIPVGIGSNSSSDLALSANARYLAFTSRAENVLGVAGFGRQAVRLDLQTNTRTLVSEVSPGAMVPFPLDVSAGPFDISISGNGNRVAFVSRSSLLVDDDMNGLLDVFVRDIQAGITRRISVASDGSEANGDSTAAVISADGASVVFESTADNLVGGDSNGSKDIFVHRLSSGVTERVSVSTQGVASDEISTSADISFDGRYVVFQSRGNLLDDGNADFSRSQIWLRDLQLGSTELISTDADGLPGGASSILPSISANGRWIAFRSAAILDPAFPTLPDAVIYLHDRQTGNNTMISLDEDEQPVQVIVGDGPRLAPDGSAVLFQRFVDQGNRGNDTLGNDPEGSIYVRLLDEQRTVRLDPQTIDGLPPNARLTPQAIDAGGRNVYLVSAASNLVPGMINGVEDIYRIDLDLLLRDGFEAATP
jgi:Tol biopolymer transport system component